MGKRWRRIKYTLIFEKNIFFSFNFDETFVVERPDGDKASRSTEARVMTVKPTVGHLRRLLQVSYACMVQSKDVDVF